MLQFIYEAERDTVENYRKRIDQAEACGETGLKVQLEDMLSVETRHRDEVKKILGGSWNERAALLHHKSERHHQRPGQFKLRAFSIPAFLLQGNSESDQWQGVCRRNAASLPDSVLAGAKPHADDREIVWEGQLRQGVEPPPAELGKIVVCARLTAERNGGVDHEHDRLARSGDQCQHGTEFDREPGLLQCLAAGGILDALPALDKTGGKTPHARFPGVCATAAQQHFLFPPDEHRDSELRVKVGRRSA